MIKTAITLGFIAVIVGVLAGVKVTQIQTMIAAGENMPEPSETVTTADATFQEWNPVIRGIGNVAAVQGVTVTTEVPGKVVKIHFESGQEVEADQILLELDASTERAQLNSAIASADLAKVSVDRARELFEKEAIAKSELDAAEARFTEAEAMVENLRALLAKKVIRAPFAGRLGIRQVNLGQFVASGQQVVSLQSIDPIYVDFYLPQQRLARLKVGYEVEVTSEDLDFKPMVGTISAIAPEVDQDTRNVLVRATLQNTTGVLRPGMFVEAVVLQPETRTVLVVPATAILFAPYGNSIFVVQPAESGSGQVVIQHFVRLGETRGDYVEILEGLEAGDTVVTTGGFKLRNRMKVQVRNDRGLEYSTEPTPEDA
ncbi:MAG: efflux RND transporter periplasmic adaptor subunit [Puniceicoccaceae bacterium]